MSSSTGFNPHTQDITMFYPDGTNLTLSLAEMDKISGESIKLCVVFASQIGACGIVFLLLAILTKPERRRTPIFFVNMLSLFLVVVRSVLQILYFTGPWYGTFAFYAYYFDDIPTSAYATSIATTAMQLCLHICIELSLILQVRVVYASNPRLNLIMTMVSIFVGLFSTGWFMAVTVQIGETTLNATSYFSAHVYPISRVVFAFSICFFSVIFVVKLGLAIRQRRVLGLEKWGPLQIIFIMGCQTMLIPAIFSVLENINAINFDGMSSLTACLVALLLPVSSMWAAATAEGNTNSRAFDPHSSNKPLKTSSNPTNIRSHTPLKERFSTLPSFSEVEYSDRAMSVRDVYIC